MLAVADPDEYFAHLMTEAETLAQALDRLQKPVHFVGSFLAEHKPARPNWEA